MKITQDEDLLSPVPSLSPVLQLIYNSLNAYDRRLFVKMFRYLWGVVFPWRRLNGVSGLIYAFWAVNLLRVRLDLTTTELSILTYIYQISKRAHIWINSNDVYTGLPAAGCLPSSLVFRLHELYKAGYLVRSFSNPDKPYLRSSFGSHPSFIKLSPSGLRLIEDMEKDLYKILVNNCMDGLKGTTKKPRKSSKRLNK